MFTRSGVKRFLFALAVSGCWSIIPATAAPGNVAITGRIVITKVMTKQRVALPAYDLRGVAVNAENPRSPAAGNLISAELARVVVYLEGPGEKPGIPTKSVMAQKNRHFVPEIVVVPVGSTVSFPNEDPIFHNVFSLSRTKAFDLGYYPLGATRTVKFDRAGIVQVYCHIHPDMSAAIVVLATGYWTRPTADGRYTLSGMTPGNYNLVAWHRSAGFFQRQITVSEGTTPAEDLVIPVKEVDSAATVGRSR